MIRVQVTCVINAPVEKVWAVIHDFNALPAWHPMVASSRIEEDLPSTAVGCVRNFQLKDGGGVIREKLLAFSQLDHSCSYSILESPLPVEDYVATLRLREVTVGGLTFGEWSASFRTAQEAEQDAVSAISNIFEQGFHQLNQVLA